MTDMITKEMSLNEFLVDQDIRQHMRLLYGTEREFGEFGEEDNHFFLRMVTIQSSDNLILIMV